MSEGVLITCVACHRINRVLEERLKDGPRCGSCKEPLFNGKPVDLTKDTFEPHVARSGLPVMIDFWAPWCGPCRVTGPIFEEAAQRLEPRVRFARVNTEDEPALAERFGIRAIPTLMVFKQGQVVERQSGAVPLADLIRWIEHAIA